MRDQVFISYSHADASWLRRLNTHLRPLIRQGTLSVWSDQQIRPGTQWRAEIASAIKRARVAVLLVTPDFLASDFIAEKELPPLLSAANSEGVAILWVAVRSSSVLDTEIANYQALNEPARPLAQLHHAHQDKELVEICKKIRDAYSLKDVEHRQTLGRFACEQALRRHDVLEPLVREIFEKLHFAALDTQGRTVGARLVSVDTVRLVGDAEVVGAHGPHFELTLPVEIDYTARVAYVQSGGYKEPLEAHEYNAPNSYASLLFVRAYVNSLDPGEFKIEEARLRDSVIELEHW